MVRQAHHDAVEGVALSLYRVALSLTKGESKSASWFVRLTMTQWKASP
jgi:hypothetical protein